MRNLVIFSTQNKLYITFTTLKRTAPAQNRGFLALYEFAESYVKLGKAKFCTLLFQQKFLCTQYVPPWAKQLSMFALVVSWWQNLSTPIHICTHMYLSNNENPTYQRAGLAKFSTPFLKVPFCGGMLNVDLNKLSSKFTWDSERSVSNLYQQIYIS